MHYNRKEGQTIPPWKNHCPMLRRYVSEPARRDTGTQQHSRNARNRNTVAPNGSEFGAADSPHVSRAIMAFANELHLNS
jgi:hypothetical protein